MIFLYIFKSQKKDFPLLQFHFYSTLNALSRVARFKNFLSFWGWCHLYLVKFELKVKSIFLTAVVLSCVSSFLKNLFLCHMRHKQLVRDLRMIVRYERIAYCRGKNCRILDYFVVFSLR